MPHDHDHSHSHSHEISSGRLLFTVVLNFIITAAEIVGGIFANSLSLISDALHNLSDALAVLISYFAIRIGKRKSDYKKTFGYKRAETLAALLNASVLVAISFFLVKEAIQRLRNPEEVHAGMMIWVASIALTANLLAVLLLRRDSKHSINIRSAYVHLSSDALASVAVIISGLAIHFFHFMYLDAITAFLIVAYVLRESYAILKEAVDILMQSTPADIDIDKIKSAVEALPEVRSLHHIHIWRMDDRETVFHGHVDVAEDLRVSEADKLRKKIEELLKNEFGIGHVTIQPELHVCFEPKVVE